MFPSVAKKTPVPVLTQSQETLRYFSIKEIKFIQLHMATAVIASVSERDTLASYQLELLHIPGFLLWWDHKIPQL